MWFAVAYAAYSIYSSSQDAAATEEAARRQRIIDEQNARYLEQDAFNAEAFGQEESAAYDPTITGTIAEQRTQMAANDIDTSFGVGREIQEESRVTGRLNQLDMMTQAREKAAGLRKQAQAVRMGAEFRQQESEAKADAQRRSGYGQAVNTGMQTYSRYSNTGTGK